MVGGMPQAFAFDRVSMDCGDIHLRCALVIRRVDVLKRWIKGLVCCRSEFRTRVGVLQTFDSCGEYRPG